MVGTDQNRTQFVADRVMLPDRRGDGHLAGEEGNKKSKEKKREADICRKRGRR